MRLLSTRETSAFPYLCYNAETRAPLDYAGWRGQNTLVENALLSLRPVTTGNLLHVRVAYFNFDTLPG